MATQRQRWQVGDLFKIALSDGSAALGHIVAREAEVLNSVTCALFDIKVPESCPPECPPFPGEEALIACLFTTHDLLNRGTWPIIGQVASQLPISCFPFEDCRKKGWVGAKVIGSGNVRTFLDAFYRLAPWDDWADPNYLDRLLISPQKKPKNLIYIKARNS